MELLKNAPLFVPSRVRQRVKSFAGEGNLILEAMNEVVKGRRAFFFFKRFSDEKLLSRFFRANSHSRDNKMSLQMKLQKAGIGFNR